MFCCYVCSQFAGYMRIVHTGKKFEKVCKECVHELSQCIRCEKNIIPGGLKTCMPCLRSNTRKFIKKQRQIPVIKKKVSCK
ncbi:hypothetical protein EhVM1_000297 [Emiliania huxleyi virus M1]|nr:hypothetical protein EhVM1_000297 [Emiliania huxleyi virus M1]